MTTEQGSNTKEPSKSEKNVSQFLSKLAKLDAGDNAIVKRVAGCSIAEARGAMSVFYRILPHDVPARDREWYFLVATLYCLERTRQLPAFKGNLGMTLRKVRRSFDSKSLDRRVNALIDSRAEPDDLGYRLRQVVKLAFSKNVAVDWHQLLVDLIHWTYPTRYVQESWVQAYYGYEFTKKTKKDDTKQGGT